MSVFPDLRRYDRIGFDTETTGVGYNDVPVGLSLWAPDGKSVYLRWGHEMGGNNCSLHQVQQWAEEQLTRVELALCGHNAQYDFRMMRAARIPHQEENFHCTNVLAALYNELLPGFSLDAVAKEILGETKDDRFLNEWCAQTFGGKPTRRAQAQNYWRAPGTVVAPYARQDAALPLKLVDTLLPRLDTIAGGGANLVRLYREIELPLIPLLLDMYFHGTRVDVPAAEALQQEMLKRLRRVEKDWKQYGANTNSSDQMAELFHKDGVVVPLTDKTKLMLEQEGLLEHFPAWIPAAEFHQRLKALGRSDAASMFKGQKLNPSVVAEWLEGLEHPAAKLTTEQRQLKHYSGTFLNSYVLDAHHDGIVHPMFFPVKTEGYGTVSGRFSSGGDFNGQNIPARDEELAPRIRGLYIAWDKDYRWVKADESQIEYRFLAHYAGGALRDAYRNDPNVDFHQMCADMSGIPRGPAKNLNFGIVYGQGVKKTIHVLRAAGISEDDAVAFYETYHEKLPSVKQTYNRAMRKANNRGWVSTYEGRVRRFREGHRGHLHTHKALNAVLQGSAADLIKVAMVRMRDIVDWDVMRLHLTVHDELDNSVLKGAEGDKKIVQMKEAMEDFPDVTVPIKADVEEGPDWGHLSPWSG